jgi:sulfate transport system permease protein
MKVALRAAPGETPGAALGRIGLRVAALVYLGAFVALPTAAVVAEGFTGGPRTLATALATPGALDALELTLVTSAVAAVLNASFGTALAYVLVRLSFPGRRLLSGVVDLPFAIPTLVSGVMLLALYGPSSPVGAFLGRHGLAVAFTPVGVVAALCFVTLPFVVRTVQPVLAELDTSEEDAARVLGARDAVVFWSVVLPALRPAIAAGTLLTFARSLGEFGSVVLISGNITGRTLTAPVFIFQLISQFKPEQAAAVSTVLFGLSFMLVLLTRRLTRAKGAGR